MKTFWPPRTRGKKEESALLSDRREVAVAAMDRPSFSDGCLLITAGLGLLWGVSVAQSQIQENIAMKEEVAELTATNARLRGRLTDSELIIDTQKYTAVALRDELTQLHKDKADLATELDFSERS